MYGSLENESYANPTKSHFDVTPSRSVARQCAIQRSERATGTMGARPLRQRSSAGGASYARGSRGGLVRCASVPVPEELATRAGHELTPPHQPAEIITVSETGEHERRRPRFTPRRTVFTPSRDTVSEYMSGRRFSCTYTWI
jgi:hypothetical protein